MKWLLLFIPCALIAKPPRHIPEELYDAYTDNGTIEVFDFYVDESEQNVRRRFYARTEVDALVEKARNRYLNYYGHTDCWLYELFDEYPDLLAGKNVAVMGSTVPWYEAMVLAYGGIPWTIEYNAIETDDDRLHLLTVEEYKKNPRTFDVILSISSFEHDGLGRYGDPLDPYGDMRAMRECLSMLKPGGKLVLSVPVGKGSLGWNAHRIYGRKRLNQLFEGWETLAFKSDPRNMFTYTSVEHWGQPVFLLEPNPDFSGPFDQYFDKTGIRHLPED